MAKSKKFALLYMMLLGITVALVFPVSVRAAEKKKLIVIDSYHKEYLWAQYTHKGFCDAMLKLGYFDNRDQITEYNQKDYVETSTSIIKRLWMDSKRKKSKAELAEVTAEFTKIINSFKPDLIFLGEDNATDYIGNQFLDAAIPIVFWGVNNTPVKYGLVNSKERPGHNITGVYQTTYYTESLQLLKAIVPRVKTFVVLSDDSTTGRIFTKSLMHLDQKGLLPCKLMGTVSTSDYEIWQRKASEYQEKADAFFVAQYSGLKDKNGSSVPDAEVAAWYIKNIKIPEAAGFRHRVAQGMLCAADDSGYNQGYEAVVIAHDMLANGLDPSTYPPRAPRRGPLLVNRQRAQQLGIKLTDNRGIEEFID